MDAPDPTRVGNAFIVSYYTVLNKNPESLHNFYSERSECAYGYEDEEGRSAKGLKEIEAVIASNKYDRCKVALTVLDCQGSVNGGILVSVVGKLIDKDGNAQKFVQSFFLERVETSFFVLNDVFRFLREEEETLDQYDNEQVQEQKHEQHQDEEGDEEEEEEEEEDEGEEEEEEDEAPAHVLLSTSAPAVEGTPAVAPETPKDQAQKPVAATPAQPAAAPTALQSAEAKVAEKVEVPKSAQSWASIVGEKSKGEPAPVPVVKTPTKPAASKPAGTTPPAAQQAQRERPAVQLPQRGPKIAPGSPILAEGCSIYARGVPSEATQEQLMTVFTQYGKVRNIIPKLAKQFAFVEYETPQAVQQALNSMKLNPPALNGRPLIIEERRARSAPTGPASSPRGTGRGRGGVPRGGAAVGAGGPGRNGAPSFGADVSSSKEFITEKGRRSSGSPANSGGFIPARTRGGERRPAEARGGINSNNTNINNTSNATRGGPKKS